jgi:hypothetical protein
VLSYCPDLPLKYHTLKAEHIKATAKQTELVMVAKDKNCASSDVNQTTKGLEENNWCRDKSLGSIRYLVDTWSHAVIGLFLEG